MKKFLAMIMALTIVLTMLTGIVVMAEPVETTEQAEVVEETAPQMPADYDESTIVQYLVFNLADTENVTIDSYLTANDGTLDYYLQMYSSYGQQIEETEYEGKRALSMGQTTITADELADTGVAYISDKGFFADKNTYVYVCGTMLNSGFTDGEKIAVVVMDLGNKTVSHEIIGGQQNSFMANSYKIHWINVLIALMCLVVLILVALIVVLTIKKKKATKVIEENDEYVSEDNLFDILTSENTEETTEVVEENAEEQIEEAAENEEE